MSAASSKQQIVLRPELWSESVPDGHSRARGTTVSARNLLHEIMKLPASERAALVESLVESLNKPDPALDALWLKEAESRITAYRAGELGAVDADEAFAELGQKT
jgi:putative addiction module component (TIGR02574 family)